MAGPGRRGPAKGSKPKPRKLGSNTGNAGKGRPKGSQNSITLQLKHALQQTFVGNGLVDWLNIQRTEKPDLYAQMILKYVPAPAPEANANGDVEGQSKLHVSVQLVNALTPGK